jgi:simple sugar transport system permease protein
LSEEEKNKKPDAGKVLIEELTKGPDKGASFWRRIWQTLSIPLLAIISGLILGAILIVVTSQDVYSLWATSPLEALKAGWMEVRVSYGALFSGSIGDPARIIAALQGGDGLEIRKAFNPILESLTASTPFIFGALAVALGFRTGLFNIGAEGQLFVGAIFAAFVGYSITGLPAIIHIPLALGAGALGGAIWGFIPGWLKAKTGGHEVINTIMLNYIAFRLSDWLLNGPMQRPDSFNPVSPTIADSAKLPRFFAEPIRFHLGFFIALGVAWLVYWFLFKTKWGFDLRSVGSNPNAARYAGMNIVASTVLAMSLSGALAGLAGTNEVLGLNHNLAMAFSSGYGFDSIALALLGKSHPAGVVVSSSWYLSPPLPLSAPFTACVNRISKKRRSRSVAGEVTNDDDNGYRAQRG